MTDPIPEPRKPGEPRVTWPDILVVTLLGTAFFVCVVVIAVRQHRAGAGVRVIRAPEAVTYRLDLNAATAGELTLLPGIGPARADKLVKWRTEHGAFQSYDDLRRAAGLSAADVERIRAMTTLNLPAPPENP